MAATTTPKEEGPRKKRRPKKVDEGVQANAGNGQLQGAAAARAWIARGFSVVPIPFREKGPTIRKWQDLDIKADEVEKYFPDPINVGLILGRNNLRDVDVDSPEAVKLAPYFLPATHMIFGRKSKTPSHYFYFCDDCEPRASLAFKDERGAMIVELRLGAGRRGAQTMAPCSVHPSGEFIEHVENGDPCHVPYAELKVAVIKIAVAALLVRGWPTVPGSRHNMALTCGAYFARAEWDVETIKHFMRAVCTVADDDDVEDRVATAANSAQNFLNGDQAYGYPQMCEEFGQAIMSRIAKWLGGEDETSLTAEQAKFPVIKLIKGQIASIVDKAEEALLAANVPIMTRAEMLVFPIKAILPAADDVKTEVTLLRAVQKENIVYQLNKHAAVFKQFSERKNKWLLADPPDNVAIGLLHKGTWQFPKVTGVITTPTMRPDGTILDQPGYDPTTQLWYSPDSYLVMPPIPDAPTEKDARAALQLLKSLLKGFPFVTDMDRTVMLAAMFAPVLRGAFDLGPMILFLAPAAGTGKSYGVDLICSIARGRPCPVITNCKSVEEMEKRLGALVLAGAPMISIDNCSSNLAGDLLCQITSQQLVQIRILGKSEMPECEWRGTLTATGNNVSVEGDLTRRTLLCNMDAKVERPELRKFEFNPIKQVLAARGKYLAAVLTIARWHHLNQKACSPIAGYEQWSKFCRAPLVALGEPDPVASMDKAREEDPVRNAARALYEIWAKEIGLGIPYTSAQLLKLAAATRPATNIGVGHADYELVRPELRDLLVQVGGLPNGQIEPRRIGNWLASLRNTIHANYRLELVKTSSSHGNQYTLAKVGV